MTRNEQVYRASSRYPRMHWPKRETWGLVAACTGWPVRLDTAVDPATVDASHRCRGYPCADQWTAWWNDRRATP